MLRIAHLKEKVWLLEVKTFLKLLLFLLQFYFYEWQKNII